MPSGVPVTSEIIPDEPTALRAALLEPADVVLVSGGSSVGQEDHVPKLLAELGELAIHGIAMRPSSPTGMGRIDSRLVFLLPGNPVSVMVTFYQFVRDALYTLMGRDPVPALPILRAVCTSTLKKAPGRTEFQRGILSCDGSGRWSVRVTGEQGSGILRSMAEANCFIILPTEQGNVDAGTMVDVQVMEGVI